MPLAAATRPGIAPVEAEEAFLYPSEGPSRASSNLLRFLPEVRGTVCLPKSCFSLAPRPELARAVTGLKHDNRSLILPDFSADIAGRTYYLDVKGVGARSPMYGFGMPSRATLRGSLGLETSAVLDHWRTRTGGDPVYTGELWFGNGPYGAHGTKESLDSIAITELCGEGPAPNCFRGFWICPVLFSTELPPWVVGTEKGRYWYRRYPGSWSQHFRLVPGNIRLYFHSDCALGVAPGRALSCFGAESREAVEGFIDRFIGSGVAALTLSVRSLQRTGSGFRLLDYDDVWLDKDSIIAPDGTVHFADIEDLEWREYRDEEGARAKVRRQFERNFFEFMFGLDALLSELFLMEGRSPPPAERRREAAARFEAALVGDGHVRTELSPGGLDLVASAPGVLWDPVVIRLVDLERGEG